VDSRLLWAGLVVPLMVSPPAKASYDFVTLTDPNLTGFTMAAGIDDAGEVVGSYRDSANNTHGFSLSGVGGSFTTLDFSQTATSTSANGVSVVNGEVEIVGVYSDGSGRHGFVLTPPAAYQSFDAPGGTGTTAGTGINSLGQLVGNFFDSAVTPSPSRGFFATGPNGSFTQIEPNLVVGANLGVNDAGDVVGSYIDGTGTHGFARIGAATITLDDPLAVGTTAATDINNAGDIVGYFVDGNGNTRGFLYVNGTYTTIDDPNAIGIPFALAMTQVFGINDHGDIVGSYVDADGVVRGFVATPAVSEPGTLALLGMSLAGTMILRRQRKSDRTCVTVMPGTN
jgi:probable HAF family extracellular repeat protein